MNAERYRQIDAIAEAALNVDTARRADFLSRACGSDQDLLQQVNALLRSYDSASDFLETPAFEAWASDVAETSAESTLAGRQVGRYIVKSHLGKGGIGEVWLARDPELERDVALKFLSRELAGNSEQARRFRQEARTASSLSHPNLVAIFDIGEFEGRQFIAQEYIRGETVRDRLASGPFSADAVARIASQIAAGLDAAHAAGIVHRDIKPENIMIRSDGVAKIVDFGIARFTDDSIARAHRVSTDLTSPGVILGTARYMSPEQARGMPVDGRSDIFSLGVVLYEMLTGNAPFTGSTPSDVLAAILTNEPAPLSQSVPAKFERIVKRCLAKDPNGRYASAAKLHDDLQDLIEESPSRSRLMPWAIGGFGVLGLIAAVALVMITTHRQPSVPSVSMRMTRIPIWGNVSDVTIARDGTLLAYILDDGDRHSIRLRETASSKEKVAVSADENSLSGIMFSPDDVYLYYRRSGKDGIGELVRVPVRGGVSEHVVGDVSGAAAVSPDGHQVAFVRLKPSTWEASLIVSNVDGTGEFPLQTVHRPQFLDERAIAWSPDGKSVACFAGSFVNEPAEAFRLIEVSLRHPSQRIVSSQLWRPRGLVWAAIDVLIVTAATSADLQQLWIVRRDSGEATRLTNDLSSYGHVAVTADGKSMVAVQSQTSVSIWAAAGNDNSRFIRISASEFSSPRIAIDWTPEGRVIYNDPTDGFRDIWRMDANGANPQRLTTSPTNKDELVFTRDGRYIVYQQDPHIWRMNSDGSDPKQLTHGRLDVHPEVSPDGKSVVYASFADWAPGIGGEPTLWRISTDGGEPTQITEQPASIPSVSPDGRQIACVHFPGKDPRLSSALLAVTRIDGSGGFTIFPRSPSEGTTLSWSPDGSGIDFVLNSNAVGNIWRQPVRGGPPFQVTHFDRDELIHFAWSREGRLLCTRGTTTHTAVLFENFR